MHRINGHTGLGRWIGHSDVGDGDILQVNINEVHVGVLNSQVLSVECTSGRTWVVDNSTSPRLTIFVAVLDRTFLERCNGVLREVETGFISTVNLEVFHGHDCSLAAAVCKHGTDVGEGDIAHGVVSGVTVSR